jgi:hypothetical protein
METKSRALGYVVMTSLNLNLLRCSCMKNRRFTPLDIENAHFMLFNTNNINIFTVLRLLSHQAL